ncbi:MAG: ribosome biogenesis GTPase Der [Planctomycetes bacterium]|nr:ribosome biogenesis GTPase Der [Planctomycetota bacterium]NOG54588.1 ribosome biogenesis GTPase Der [Planctomycetota bacterium]
MSAPRVAIVGRPNVGKSSLLNMLARDLVSIVDPTPGVTRDRVSVFVDLDPPKELEGDPPIRTIEVVDTGGYGIYTGDDDDSVSAKALRQDVEFQIGQAVNSADLILFLVDARTGLAALDYTIAELLRRQGMTDRVQVVANKVDGEGLEADAMEAMALGMGEPWIISARAGYNKRTFLDALYQAVPESSHIDDAVMRLAIVGKRNAGKSTLVNELAGQKRVIVSEIPGTTRDAVDVRFEIEGRAMVAIDTAGVRKKKSLQGDIEFYSQSRAIRSVQRADVVLLMIDATVPVSQVDKKLADEVLRLFKPCVIVINKWDLAEGKPGPKKGKPVTQDDYLEYLDKELTGLSFAPIVFMEAANGVGVRDSIAMAFTLYEQSGHRETTGHLNGVFKRILEQRGPSSRLGKQAKIYYVTQVSERPPTIAIVVNHSDLFEGQYERYLLNRLREHLAYSEVPIRLLFRDRKRVSLNALKSRPMAHNRPDAAEDVEPERTDDSDLG